MDVYKLRCFVYDMTRFNHNDIEDKALYLFLLGFFFNHFHPFIVD